MNFRSVRSELSTVTSHNPSLSTSETIMYDSYSKWPKIYDANKDVISDPDRIKPGILLKIPEL